MAAVEAGDDDLPRFDDSRYSLISGVYAVTRSKLQVSSC